jgi:hypothetical protein
MNFLIITSTSLLILILPGLAICAWIKDHDLDFAEQLVNCIGLSISITAILFLLTFFIQFQINLVFLTVFYALCGLIAAAGLIHRKARLSWSWDIPIVLILLATVLALRFIQINDLLLPAWVDSVHHVLITRIIAERGAIPATLEPYLQVPFSYYFGFHGIAAVFSMVSGFTPENAVLVIGQVLNACVPLAIYRLGRVFWGDRSRALIAGLLVAFVSQMPAYYVTWGRYTLLTGMLMLALVIANMIESFHSESQKKYFFILPLLIMGLTLSHYFSALIFILFFIIYVTVTGIHSGRRLTLTTLKNSIPILIGFILLAPWMIRAYDLTGYNVNIDLNIPFARDGWLSIQSYSQYLLKLSGPLRNYLFLSLGILGIAPTMIDKRTRSLSFLAVTILITSLPLGIKLPNIRPDHMAIILFFPLSLCAANFLFIIWGFLSRLKQTNRLYTSLLILPLLAFCVWGVIETRSITNKDTILVSRADISAIQWIKVNVPSGSRFLINATYWQGSTYRGVDGGYWLLPLTGFSTVPPPAIYTWGDQEAVISMNSTAKAESELFSCDTSFHEILANEGISYIYVKDGVGSLQANHLFLCDDLELIYSEEGVFIFRVK